MTISTSTTVPVQRRCRVHGPIAAGAPHDLCPRCLLQRGMKEKDTPEPSRLPMRFGDYELLAVLGRGGMGVVYRARHVGLGHEVALKRISEDALTDPGVRRRFWEEARIVVGLRHRNIVPIHDVREHDGQPYFTMDLMSGGTLDAALERFHAPRRAAALVAKLAHAAHAYHGKGIIHRDLKPVNILFHEAPDKPHIADFGVAKYLDDGRATLTNAFIGTAPYMAPEQRPTNPQRDTPAADVWSLGVILYELLAGQRPFRGPTFLEVLRSAEEDEPEPLHEARPEIGRDLAAVCHMCLRKEPKERYRTAEDLVEDLQRYRRGEPVLARDPSRAERAWSWCLRHPTGSAVFGAAAIALVTLTLWAFLIARGQEQARRHEVLATNVYAARAVAGTVLAQLDEYAGWVAKEAGNPRLASALARGDDDALDALCRAIQARHGGGASHIAWWFIADARGFQRAHVPHPQITKGYYFDYAFRDYFRGAQALPRDADPPVYISRVYVSSGDDGYKVAIVSPLGDERGAFAGMLGASISTNRSFGTLKLSDGPRHAVLTARRDRDTAGEAWPDQDVLLVHDGVEHGEGVLLESAALRRLTARRTAKGAGRAQLQLPPSDWVESQDDYQDPLAERASGGAGGLSLAGVAPVGGTELSVIVYTPVEDAVRIGHAPFRVLAGWSVGGAALLLASLFAAVRATRRRLSRAAA